MNDLMNNMARKFIVQCPHCQGTVKITEGNYAFQCPLCDKLFRMRITTSVVRDITDDPELTEIANEVLGEQAVAAEDEAPVEEVAEETEEAVEEAPAEEVVEETEETVDEAPVEEAPTEEVVEETEEAVEEAPTEEVVEETEETEEKETPAEA